MSSKLQKSAVQEPRARQKQILRAESRRIIASSIMAAVVRDKNRREKSTKDLLAKNVKILKWPLVPLWPIAACRRLSGEVRI